ncbi:MAG: NAD(P)/FAD-dependent oxidoreductase, partial [Desulfovibrio sp.]|nr:NAD(P)/FAD-dependent oxidoreductase [Desulfovibrio sp.]
MPEIYDEIIIGAGAAGLFAGVFAAAKTLVLEKGRRGGTKLAISGGGRANFSNRKLSPRFYLSRPDGNFPESVLRRFGFRKLTSLFSQWGLPWEERAEGKFFLKVPARSLVDVLLRKSRCEIIYERAVKNIIPGAPFVVVTNRGDFYGRKILIASGSPAAPQLGGDGRLWEILKRLGHTVRPPEPALVPLLWQDETRFAALAGISARAKVSWRHSLGILKESEGDILFTHKGLSGPAIL